jgi:hypothetical protein
MRVAFPNLDVYPVKSARTEMVVILHAGVSRVLSLYQGSKKFLGQKYKKKKDD